MAGLVGWSITGCTLQQVLGAQLGAGGDGGDTPVAAGDVPASDVASLDVDVVTDVATDVPGVTTPVAPTLIAWSSGGNWYPRAMVRTRAGEYVIVGDVLTSGTMQYDAFAVSVAPNGTPTWAHWFGGAFNDRLVGVAELSDGDLVAVGKTTSFEGTSAASQDLGYVIRFGADGTLRWSRHELAEPMRTDAFLDVAATPDGGFVALSTRPDPPFGAGITCTFFGGDGVERQRSRVSFGANPQALSIAVLADGAIAIDGVVASSSAMSNTAAVLAVLTSDASTVRWAMQLDSPVTVLQWSHVSAAADGNLWWGNVGLRKLDAMTGAVVVSSGDITAPFNQLIETAQGPVAAMTDYGTPYETLTFGLDETLGPRFAGGLQSAACAGCLVTAMVPESNGDATMLLAGGGPSYLTRATSGSASDSCGTRAPRSVPFVSSTGSDTALTPLIRTAAHDLPVSVANLDDTARTTPTVNTAVCQ